MCCADRIVVSCGEQERLAGEVSQLCQYCGCLLNVSMYFDDFLNAAEQTITVASVF